MKVFFGALFIVLFCTLAGVFLFSVFLPKDGWNFQYFVALGYGAPIGFVVGVILALAMSIVSKANDEQKK